MQLSIIPVKPLLQDLFFALASTPFLISSACAQQTGWQNVTGNEKFMVINGTTTIGCLDATGAYVLDNCAVFSNGGTSSSHGGCDFYDSEKMRNPFVGAPATFAFSCYKTGVDIPGTGFYYINNDICTADLACYYTISISQPPVENQQVDFNIYFWDDTTVWGSVPKGWTLVTLQWQQISS